MRTRDATRKLWKVQLPNTSSETYETTKERRVPSCHTESLLFLHATLSLGNRINQINHYRVPFHVTIWLASVEPESKHRQHQHQSMHGWLKDEVRTASTPTHPSKFRWQKFPQTPAFASITQLHPKGLHDVYNICHARSRCHAVRYVLSFSLPAFFSEEVRKGSREKVPYCMCPQTARHWAKIP